MSRSYKKNPGRRQKYSELKRINTRKLRRQKDFAVNGGAYRRVVWYGYNDNPFDDNKHLSYERLIKRSQPHQKYFSFYSSKIPACLDEEARYDWWAKNYLRK